MESKNFSQKNGPVPGPVPGKAYIAGTTKPDDMLA